MLPCIYFRYIILSMSVFLVFHFNFETKKNNLIFEFFRKTSLSKCSFDLICAYLCRKLNMKKSLESLINHVGCIANDLPLRIYWNIYWNTWTISEICASFCWFIVHINQQIIFHLKQNWTKWISIQIKTIFLLYALFINDLVLINSETIGKFVSYLAEWNSWKIPPPSTFL